MQHSIAAVGEVGVSAPPSALSSPPSSSLPSSPSSSVVIAEPAVEQVVADADEKQRVVDGMKPVVALYMGGMGAKEANFHNQVFVRMGYESLAAEVQELYQESLAATDETEAAALLAEAAKEKALVDEECARLRLQSFNLFCILPFFRNNGKMKSMNG